MTYKKLYIATLDIETKDGLKGCEFAVGGFYTKYKNKDCYIIEQDYKTFFTKIFDFSFNKRVICYVHNEDFDIRFVMKFVIDELNLDPFVIQSESRILEIQVKEYGITFRDSFQFLLCSQKEAEQSYLNSPIKLEVDFDKLLKDLNSKNLNKSLNAYNILYDRVKSDIKGLYEIMMTFHNYFNKDYGVNSHRFVTLPTLSLNIFDIKYLREKFKTTFASINPYIEYLYGKGYNWKSGSLKELYDWTRLSYFGGICLIFNLNKLKNVYYYDFNSLYPSMCVTYPYPNPKRYTELKHISLDTFKRKINKKYLYIIEATVKENLKYPILPIRDTESVKFVNGIKSGVWCSPEFERFLEFPENEILEVTRIRVYYEEEFYLKDFMYDRYVNRQKFIKDGDKARAFNEKIIMNSLTGKFAQRPKRESWVLYNKEFVENMKFDNKEINIIEYEEKYKLIKYEVEILKNYLIPEWTSFITSYSRTTMHKLFYALQDEGIDFYYCDTDCVFTNKPIELNKNLKYLIGDDLGQLKNELNKEKSNVIPKFDYAKFYLPKVYVLQEGERFHIKAKGISQFMIYETLGIKLVKNDETYKELIQKLNSFEKIEDLLFNTGVYINRYLKYKSSLRRNYTLVSHAKIEKKVKKIYDKRKVLYDLTTQPLTIDELEDLEEVRTQNLNILLNNVNTSYVNHQNN